MRPITKLRLRPGLVPLAALALSCGSAMPAPGRVIGEDSRSRLSDADQGRFAGVGRLACIDRASGTRGYSTATLVGDHRTVLGVGHFRALVVNGRLVPVPLEDCRFELYGSDRRRFFSASIESVAAALPPHVYRRSSYGMPDWAVFRLARPAPAAIPPVRLGPQLLVARRDATAFMVAYHDSPAIPDGDKIYAPDCAPRPLVDMPYLFAHSCDTSRGSSGGLLFLETSRGTRAIGMNTADGPPGAPNLGQIFSPELIAALPRIAFDPDG